MDDALEVKDIEKVCKHDVNAVEYLLKWQSHPDISKVLEFFHFACTSEDINNLAHASMLKESMNPALPTTLGKEMSVFAARLSEQKHKISHVKIKGKFAGAIGNYNAHLSAYPNAIWPQIAREFVESRGLCFIPYVTQRDLTDSIVPRNMGEGFGHSLFAYKSALQGIAKLQLCDITHTAEPLQTVMGRYGVPESYKKLKELARGRAVTKDSIKRSLLTVRNTIRSWRMGYQCENLGALCPIEHGDSGIPFLLQRATYLVSSIPFKSFSVSTVHFPILYCEASEIKLAIWGDALTHSHFCKYACSEEVPELQDMGGPAEGGFSVAFDPLDGSSIVDTNFSVGTIFGVWPGDKLIGVTGRDQVAAAMGVYGPRTTYVLALKDYPGTHEFLLLDEGKWQHVKETTEVGEGKLFSPGNLRATFDNPDYEKLISYYVKEKYTLRYTGGMVPDVNQIIVKEKGVFTNVISPTSKAKLRLLFEVAPLGLLVEKAGGYSSDGHRSVLDKEIINLDDRTQVAYGSKNEIIRFEETLYGKSRLAAEGVTVGAAA
ncbi:hypothetical protein OIU77_012510 [Salix suchowensis]|nr:hypothetical protein OIU77_012510 [Salix suchowensis]